MLFGIPPGLLLILGALPTPFLPGRWRQAWLTALPLAGLWALANAEPGVFYGFAFFDFELEPVRIDGLSLIFGYIFHIAAALSVVYAWHGQQTSERDRVGQIHRASSSSAIWKSDGVRRNVQFPESSSRRRSRCASARRN